MNNVAEFGALRSVVSTVQLVGPPLGGALFGLGRALPFVANATLVLFSLGSILSIRTPFQEAREPEEVEPLRSQLAEGLRWLWSRPFLRTCALLFSATNLIYEGLILVVVVVVVVVGRRQGLSSGALIGTWSPSIRDAPSLSELDELPAPVSA